MFCNANTVLLYIKHGVALEHDVNAGGAALEHCAYAGGQFTLSEVQHWNTV